METVKAVVKAIWIPAVRRAVAEGVLAVAATVVAAVAAYFAGAANVDPMVALMARIVIAWAERVIFQAKTRLTAEKASETPSA